MNKIKIDGLISPACDALEKVKIVNDDKIDNAWNGQIASFGASIATGSLLAAVAFFSTESEKTKVDDRSKLIKAIFELIETTEKDGCKSLFDYVVRKKKDGKERSAKENIINAAIALKLAMKVYDLGKGDKNNVEPSKNES